MVLHVDAEAMELNAFGLEAHALFEAVFAGEEDLAARADDTLPRDSVASTVECPCSLTGCTGKSRGVGDVSVSGNLAAGDTADLGEDSLEHVGRLGHGEDFKLRKLKFKSRKSKSKTGPSLRSG
jgi:hypothetical protein